MRDIKFRGLPTDGKGWVYGDFVTNNLGTTLIADYPKQREDVVIYKTVGEFTGIFDKNNKEIYEGDKCKVTFYNYVEKNTEIIMEVVFTEGGFALIKEGKITTECIMEDDRTFVPLYYSQKPNSIEVIGNIHTTPELLNPSNK
jgi:uncharacterized phage protein (TIGR01671 family)